MREKAVSCLTLTLLLVSAFVAIDIHPVESDWTWTETIYIRADGCVEPDTVPISSVDNVTYTLTDNIVGDITEEFKAIVVERDNIVVDGAGYTVQGTGSGTGIDLSERNNVTIKNVEIGAFCIGIYLSHSSNNKICENNIMHCFVHGIGLEYSDSNDLNDNNVIGTNYFGIELYYSDDNLITENNLVDTVNGSAIFMHYSKGNKIYHNNFINNSIRQAYLYSLYNTTWDDGYPSGGNYWSDHVMVDDYSGINQDEPGSDGIVDEPYVIDADNRDRYPLLSPWTGISGNLQILEPLNGQMIVGPATITFLIENTGERAEFLQGDANNRIDLEIEYRSTGGEIYGWGVMCWSTSTHGLTLSSGEIYEHTLVYDPLEFEGSVPPGFIGDAPYGESTIRLVHWRRSEHGFGYGEFGRAEIQVTFQRLTWEHIFEDERRSTTLKVSTDDRYFQFIAPDKAFSVKHDPNMTVTDYFIYINYEDTEIAPFSIAVIMPSWSFCVAIAEDVETGTRYLLIYVTSPLILGDIDYDEDVDFDDFIVFSGCYGTTIEEPCYDPRADFNKDAYIDYSDFIVLAGNYGRSAA